MRLAVRSLRNLIRSPLRTGLIITILAFSTGLALIMLNVSSAFGNQLDSVSEDLGTEIQVRPAGSFGFMGGGEPLNAEDVAELSGLSHVVSVQPSVQTQYTGTSLESAVEPGSLFRGSRGQGSTGSGFTMPIITMGFDPATEEPTLLGGGALEIVSGRYFTAGEIDADVVVMGQALAEKNGLDIGSTVDVNDTTVEVIGIYASGQAFGDNMLVMPIDTALRLFDIEGLTSVTVIVDNVANINAVADAIRQEMGEDAIDVITTEEIYDRIGSTLESASSTSQIGMISALVVAAAVIIFAVVLMVRQRIKEIGILKAIGASNWHISLQFATESLIISVIAVIFGALMSLPLAQTVADMLVSSTGTTAGAFGGGGFPGGDGGFLGRGFFGGGSTVVGVDVAISSGVFIIALGMAVALTVIASVFPSWYVARIKPAEVLRSE